MATMRITIKDIKGGFVEVDLEPVLTMDEDKMTPAQALACFAIDYINDCLSDDPEVEHNV